jgi:hypothetical protein
VIALERDGVVIRAYAHALDGTDVEVDRADLPSEEGLSAEALVYSSTLAAVGLVAGELQPLSESAGGKALQQIGMSFTAGIAQHEFQPWASEPGISAGLAAFRTRVSTGAVNGCTTFQAKYVVLSATTAITFGLDLGDGSALIATIGGMFYHLVGDTPMPVGGLSIATPHDAAFRTDDGTIWMVSRAGTLASGRGLGPFTVISTASIAPDLPKLDGSRGDAPFELWLAGRHALQRFDGSKWTVVAQGIPLDTQRGNPSVAWLGPGTADAFDCGPSDTVLYAHDSTVSVDAFGMPGGEHVDSMAHGTSGALLATNFNLRSAVRPFAPLVHATQEVSCVAIYQGALLYGGFRGTLDQFVPATATRCAPQYPTNAPYSALVPLGSRVLLLHRSVTDDNGHAAFDILDPL